MAMAQSCEDALCHSSSFHSAKPRFFAKRTEKPVAGISAEPLPQVLESVLIEHPPMPRYDPLPQLDAIRWVPCLHLKRCAKL